SVGLVSSVMPAWSPVGSASGLSSTLRIPVWNYHGYEKISIDINVISQSFWTSDSRNSADIQGAWYPSTRHKSIEFHTRTKTPLPVQDRLREPRPAPCRGIRRR